MRYKIVALGQTKLVILISLVSVIGSVLVYIPLAYLLFGEILLSGFVISLLIPMIIAPAASWYISGLLIKLHYMELEMRDLANYDGLTKLMSRNAFLTNSKSLYQLMKRDKSSMAILYLDLDNFKVINDTYGHSIGDEVLKSVGSIMLDNKRDSDLAGRIGGEEFAITLPNINKQGALHFAENIRNIIKQKSLKYKNIQINFTISIGVSVLNNENDVTFEELIKQSDKALYMAKDSGKDCTKIYE